MDTRSSLPPPPPISESLDQWRTFFAAVTAEEVLNAWLYQCEGRSVGIRFRGGWWVATAFEPAVLPRNNYEVASGLGVTPNEAREALASHLRNELARTAAKLGTLTNVLNGVVPTTE